MRFFLYIIVFFISFQVFSQDTVRSKKKLSLPEQAKAVEKSFSEKDPEAVAREYETLARNLMAEGEYAKAEDYLKRALAIYQKSKNKEKTALLTRMLAQVQENQMKLKEATSNYQIAGEMAVDKREAALNRNDASRLAQPSPEMQSSFLDSNIMILEESEDVEEVVTAYKKKAEIGLMADDKEGAIRSLEKAAAISKDRPEETVKLKSEIAKIYESDNQLDKAIETVVAALDEAKILGNAEQEVIQKQVLAGLLLKKNRPEEALLLFEEAYNEAVRYGKTREAKATVETLAKYFQSRGEALESIVWHERFLKDFDVLIRSDSSLIDTRIFEVTEEKIRRLEQEKALKDELILKKNRFNYVLIGSVIMMLVLLGFIVRALRSIQSKNKRIALQSLRREMNPHFIFNSLNSVNQFIAQNKEIEANKYLTSYSNLMRRMMETSNKDFILLSQELEQIRKYLDLEHLRFQDKFDYEIQVDETLDTDAVWVPNMLIQPHLENAIWHGLRYKEERGKLKILFERHRTNIRIMIDDDGIGMEKSRELKTSHQKKHESRGLKNVSERVKLLKELYGKEIVVTQSEHPEHSGTQVVILCPLIQEMI